MHTVLVIFPKIVMALERAKHSFFALPNPLSCSVMNKICLNQIVMAFLVSYSEGKKME